MTGEIAIGGVYVPTLLLLGLVAMLLTGVLSRMLAAFGLYRFLAYRPLVDIGMFVIVLGLLVVLTAGKETVTL